ncbi:MAG: hypothetical protein IT285_00810 [Bdellovibrionales bacterium]|nr:hypothetical protein [Bdellovibrionales bacterium]
MARVFNTALISTQGDSSEEFSEELFRVMKSPAFHCILSSVQALAQRERLSERDAAEKLVQTFRKLDSLWSRYVVREGLEKIRGPQSRPVSTFRS